MDAWLILTLLTGFIAVLAAVLLFSTRSAAQSNFFAHAVQAHAVPIRRHALLFSKAERSFYQALRSLVPAHMIFVKVKLTDLVSVEQPQRVWEHFSSLNRRHVDFLVCDPTL